MSLRRVVNGLFLLCVFACSSVAAMASAYHGQVTFSGLPLPGSTVTVTATQGDKKVVAISDEQGMFGFADLADGKWSLTIEMTGFAPLKQEITVAPDAAAGAFEMKVMTLDQIRAEDKPVHFDPAQLANPAVVAVVAAPSAATVAAAKTKSAAAGAKTQAAAAAPEAPPPPDATSAQANDGTLINGSVNNAATSQYSMNAAFGNNRNGGHSLYNGNVVLTLENSSLDAASYNLTGQPQPKPQFNNYTAGITYGGPLNIKHLMPRGPNMQINYSHSQDSSINTQPILIPNPATEEDSAGDWNLTSPPGTSPTSPGAVTSITVPSNLAAVAPGCNSYLLSTGVTQTQINSGTMLFANNTIPAQCVTSASKVLLSLYPQQTNLNTDPQYNYELPLNTTSSTDNIGLSGSHPIGTKSNLFGRWNFSNSKTNQPSIFGWSDTSSTLGTNATLNLTRRFTQRLYGSVTYTFGRSRSQLIPYFANKNNIEGTAGITGASTAPAYWGPPSLSFSSGIYGLSDQTYSYNRRENNGISVNMNWNHLRHNVQFGGAFSRLESNYNTESNPDGALSFTGAATRSSSNVGGSDFADFLLGIPDNSNIAYGNPDKYLRQTTSYLFVLDDFRMSPEFTLNAGVRWEYGSPASETKGRLVNLNIGPGFATATPVTGSNPLLQPDYSRPEPHVSFAWRPISGSSLLVRSGYDVTNDTSLYQSFALKMAQQVGPAPALSTSLQTPNGPACPFNIFSPFAQQSCTTTSPDQYAIDPHFHVAYVQTWYLTVERDLPASLHLTATYLGIKGTRGVQEFQPNTCAPIPGLTACPGTTGPFGYVYRTSNGNSTREAGTLELRRRLRAGFQARLLYTYSKSLDDDYSLSAQGSVNNASGFAQDWTNPSAQRGLSTTDQRHVVNLTAQYTTGMGLGGKMLLGGWRGAIYKEWTVQAIFSAGSGLPETPIYQGVTALGTGFGGSIRPNVTGSPYAGAAPGYVLNVNNYSAPAAGTFGDARRDSIEGPDQFSLNAAMLRTFRLHDKYTLDATLSANNVLNHVVYGAWNPNWIPGSTTFGEPTSPSQMRSVSVNFRARF
jgi:hypothetical protein